MESKMREVKIRAIDVELFEPDMSPADYDFFKKHTGAFKRMLEDQSKEKKQEFVDSFRDFSVKHGCLKDTPKNDSRLTYLQEATLVYKETFVLGKVSHAKSIVTDAAVLAQNKHLLQNMGAKSYSKDPFFHKETRDVFRRRFGSPSMDGTFIKVICILPLHIKFAGAICRYLRRWLDAEPKPLASLLPEGKKSKQPSSHGKSTSKKKEKELAKIKADEAKRDFEEMKYFLNEIVAKETNDPRHLEQIRESIEVFRELTHPDEKKEKNKEPEEHVTLAKHLQNKKSKGKLNYKNPSRNKSVVHEINPAKEEKDSSLYTDEMMAHYQNDEFFTPLSSDIDKSEGDSKKELDDDNSFEEIKKMMLLDKPHPNVEFEQLLGKKLTKENELKLRQCKENAKQLGEQFKSDKKSDSSCAQEKEKKRHACANCRKVEPEPRTFKKCQRCHGKKTKFYCSRSCQETDWITSHREDHNSIEDIT